MSFFDLYLIKGKLPDGQEIAVKRFDRGAISGDVQFENEILTLSKLQHKNLVRLLGFCLEEEEMLLIYEFVINRSLDNFLFGKYQSLFCSTDFLHTVSSQIHLMYMCIYNRSDRQCSYELGYALQNHQWHSQGTPLPSRRI